MKKWTIEKRLKEDIDRASPSDFQSMWKRCEESLDSELDAVPVAVLTGGREAQTSNKKKRIYTVLVAAVLFLTFVWGCLFGVQNLFFDKKTRFKQGYFVLDINPSVEVDYDENGKVTGAVGLNDDGKALLIGVDLTEKSYEEATEFLLQHCIAMGYFSAAREDNAVLVTAVSESGQKDEKMTSAVKTSFASAFAENKVRGVVITGVSDPALQQSAQRYGINAQKYGLILSYLALGGELEESRYSSVSIRELYSFIEQKEQVLKEAKKADSQIILQKFETELRETLSEQIEALIKTLNVYLSTEENGQKETLVQLQGSVAALESAKQQKERKKIVNAILSGLDELKTTEEDSALIAMIESAKISISVTYDFFEKAFFQLKKVSATPEEISAWRLWKFASYGGGEEEYDFAAWQKERENIFSSEWYTMKESWRIDRERDI